MREAFFEKRATVAGHPEEWTLAFLNGENCEVVAAYLTPTDEMAIASALQARVNETLQVFANVLETFLDPQRSGLPTDPAAWQNDIFRERSFTTQVKGFEITLIQEGVDRLLGADMGPKYLLEIKGGQPIGRERQKKLLHRLELEPTDPAVALLKKLRRS